MLTNIYVSVPNSKQKPMLEWSFYLIFICSIFVLSKLMNTEWFDWKYILMPVQ